MNLTLKQIKAIKHGTAPIGVCKQLESKELAEVTESYLSKDGNKRLGDIELTDAGEKAKRKIEDPTIDHLR